ncbi:MAG TPA: hypothetical protein VHX44_14570, partial [Planctomycetota bacterium]|nr:hypothetical protein [Planctomycetota bacterium]
PASRFWQRWIFTVFFAFPFMAYGVVYLFCCERMTNGMMEEVLWSWFDEQLLVFTPPGTCGLFFPATCVEAMVRGCWRGVTIIGMRTRERWDLSTCSWGFNRQKGVP